MKHETRLIYRAASAVLTDKEFQAWDRYHRLERSYQDIAKEIGVDRSTIQRRVKRADAKIHHKLEEAA